MGRFIGRAFVYLVFGFFVYETTKGFNRILGLSVSPYYGIVYVVLVYAFQEFAFRRLQGGDRSLLSSSPADRIAGKLVPFIAGTITVSFLLYISAVFAGLIYSEILKAR